MSTSPGSTPPGSGGLRGLLRGTARVGSPPAGPPAGPRRPPPRQASERLSLLPTPAAGALPQAAPPPPRSPSSRTAAWATKATGLRGASRGPCPPPRCAFRVSEITLHARFLRSLASRRQRACSLRPRPERTWAVAVTSLCGPMPLPPADGGPGSSPGRPVARSSLLLLGSWSLSACLILRPQPPAQQETCGSAGSGPVSGTRRPRPPGGLLAPARGTEAASCPSGKGTSWEPVSPTLLPFQRGARGQCAGGSRLLGPQGTPGISIAAGPRLTALRPHGCGGGLEGWGDQEGPVSRPGTHD